MMLYLLFPVLIIYGVVESQTAKVTEEQLSKAELNQTFNGFPTYNITMKPENGNNGNNSQIDDNLQKNKTSVFTEEDEDFQEEKNMSSAIQCNRQKLIKITKICVTFFETVIKEISPEDWCVLKEVLIVYEILTECLEEKSYFAGCFYPNPEVQDIFIYIHSTYFKNCTKEEHLLDDAPQGLVIVLTLIPVSLIPALVYLVVWKSKVQD